MNKPDYSERIDPLVGRVPNTYREISLPICVAWEWETPRSTNQLVWHRDESPMIWGLKSAGGAWKLMVCCEPRMAGITTLTEARQVAEWFINGHMLPEHDGAYARENLR